MTDLPLREKLEQLAERLRANRYEVHADCCDDGDHAVPCESKVCAIEYEAECALQEAAAALDAAEQRGAARGIEVDSHHNALACPYCNPNRLALVDTSKVTRFEVIDHRPGSHLIGRAFSALRCRVEVSLQDNERTMKVFVDEPSPPQAASSTSK